jgi:hypothetical protein
METAPPAAWATAAAAAGHGVGCGGRGARAPRAALAALPRPGLPGPRRPRPSAPSRSLSSTRAALAGCCTRTCPTPSFSTTKTWPAARCECSAPPRCALADAPALKRRAFGVFKAAGEAAPPLRRPVPTAFLTRAVCWVAGAMGGEDGAGWRAFTRPLHSARAASPTPPHPTPTHPTHHWLAPACARRLPAGRARGGRAAAEAAC